MLVVAAASNQVQQELEREEEKEGKEEGEREERGTINEVANKRRRLFFSFFLSPPPPRVVQNLSSRLLERKRRCPSVGGRSQAVEEETPSGLLHSRRALKTQSRVNSSSYYVGSTSTSYLEPRVYRPSHLLIVIVIVCTLTHTTASSRAEGGAAWECCDCLAAMAPSHGNFLSLSTTTAATATATTTAKPPVASVHHFAQCSGENRGSSRGR